MVGQKGLTESLIQSARDELERRELIKVRFVDHKDEKKDLAGRLSLEAEADLVGLIGNTAILYRENPDPEKRVIRLPKGQA
jgi:RNA-binding protein